MDLGKNLEGSTISIGGEEKKAKITNDFLSSFLINGDIPVHVSQGTEDATKWNECLSPESFALMHRFLFDPTIRAKLNVPARNELRIKLLWLGIF